MNTPVTRKQTSFRLSESLLGLRLASGASRPNNVTLAAMSEAESGADLETLDLSDFRRYVDSL